MACPVCDHKEFNGNHCTRCAYEVRAYIGIRAEAARAADAQRIAALRQEWQAQNGASNYAPDYRPDFQREWWETVAEWKTRLEARPVLAGQATLLTAGYDIETGRFPLEVVWEDWSNNQVFVHDLAIMLPRNEARSLYEASPRHPLYGWLNVADQNWSVTRLELVAHPRIHPLRVLTLAERTFQDPFLHGRGQGPEMVIVPAGTFVMGETGARQAAFAIGKYPVTFEEWDACVTAKGVTYRPDDRQWGRGRQPVIQVSWDDACAYTAWLSQQTGKTYRLPTDAEWEYACRAGTGTLYSFGDDEALLPQYAWFNGNSEGRAHPVGEKEPNPWGLYDMHGNVWEWTADAHESGGRLLRGGSWGNGPRNVRSAYRVGIKAANRNGNYGFRLARTL